ncbi:TetR/AcrR family transcriptional regulator C-terminal domain-containing protein [Streptomyces sp. RKND-216]|uniref:TetR/AcrR family transcriptional regulator C-terminal domain-containing protein n=1 Tax=Streptomyces sp. RKND-216 TaxID=2562581 RepID=UPI0014471215|nr:TetR/AcrR family transcriptional regulator C-terminal domain-containing protein [Streptomyces sp. RKND-216]
MRGLEGLSLTDQQRLSVIFAVESYVSGSARDHLNALEAARLTGVSDEEFWAAQAPFLTEAMQSGGFPSLAELDEDTFDVAGNDSFTFALARPADGIADFVETARADG